MFLYVFWVKSISVVFLCVFGFCVFLFVEGGNVEKCRVCRNCRVFVCSLSKYTYIYIYICGQAASGGRPAGRSGFRGLLLGHRGLFRALRFRRNAYTERRVPTLGYFFCCQTRDIHKSIQVKS